MPVTFDGLVALCCAASLAAECPDKFCSIHFVRDSYRRLSDRDIHYDDSVKRWRSSNILTRGAGLIDIVNQVTVMDHRNLSFIDEDIYPAKWRADKPLPLPYSWKAIRFLHEQNIDFRRLKSGVEAKRGIKSYLSKNRKNVSLSIRNADFRQSRDSNIQNWVELFNYLEHIGYHCIIVPDQNTALSSQSTPFPTERVNWAAAIDLELRLALYESCFGNLTWTGGHSSIMWLSHSSFLNFGSLNSSSFISDEQYWHSHGVSTRENISCFLKNQIYDWKEASEVTLAHLIDKSCSYLENMDV